MGWDLVIPFWMLAAVLGVAPAAHVLSVARRTPPTEAARGGLCAPVRLRPPRQPRPLPRVRRDAGEVIGGAHRSAAPSSCVGTRTHPAGALSGDVPAG